jgi:FixJ family two-component response regulator
VDEDFRVRESLEGLLGSVGYTPVVFRPPRSSWDASRGDLCEYRRPDSRDGWYRVAATHKLERPDLPVILISAHDNAESRRRAIEEGVVHFLYKPFDATDLLGTIQLALTNAREK